MMFFKVMPCQKVGKQACALQTFGCVDYLNAMGRPRALRLHMSYSDVSLCLCVRVSPAQKYNHDWTACPGKPEMRLCRLSRGHAQWVMHIGGLGSV